MIGRSKLPGDRPVGLQGEVKLDLKEKIIFESLRLFSLKGYLNTSIGDILQQANTSKGGFYNHFKSKDELFHTVLSQARKIWRKKVLHGVDDIEQPVQKVRKILENYRDLYLKDSSNIPGGCVFVTLSVELDDQRPDFAKEITEGFCRTRAMIKRLLEQAKASGGLASDLDTDSVSGVLFAGMLGASVLYGMNKSSETLECLIGSFIDYLEGLATRDHAVNPGEQGYVS